MRVPTTLIRSGFGLAVALARLSGQTAAAPGGPPESGPAPVTLEKYEVTGSYIPFASTQTALPLTTVDAKAIADSGIATNVLEVLRKTVPQFSGSGNIGNDNANANLGTTGGGSMLALRNTQTLVLVNGRRMTYAPILASGGSQFVDVNLIPLSAIERIEILQDGASATYGTDAIAGVVNIILKTDFSGAELGSRYAVSDHPGRYSERAFSAVGGAQAGRTSLTFSAEYSVSDPLFQNQRAFSTPIYGTPSFAGVINTRTPGALPQFYVLNPALAAPPAGHTPLATLVAQGVYLPVEGTNLSRGLGSEQQYAFNLADYVTLLLRNERRSGTLNFRHRATAQVELFGDVIGTRTRTFSQLNAQPLAPTLPATNAANPTTQPMVVRNRYVDHPRLFSYDSTSLRTIAGARGSLPHGLQWEAAANQNTIQQDYTNQNVVDSAVRASAISRGLINLAARTPAPGALEAAGIFGTAWGRARSELATLDARLTGELLQLPGGPVGFAAGTEYRRESLRQDADINSQTATFNWDSGVSISPFGHGRRVWSSFAEVRVPLVGARQQVPWVAALELDAAVRHERYSDEGRPTVPKLSLAWRPVPEDLLLRATYSESFAAPTLFNLYGPVTPDDLVTTQLPDIRHGITVMELHVRSGANPDLLPSRSQNYSAGLVWSPHAAPGFTLTADAFDITQRDLVSTIDLTTMLQHVELNGAASSYAPFVKLGGYNGAAITAAGQLSANALDAVYATNTLVNISGLNLRGAGARLAYSSRGGAAGRFEAAVALNYYRTYTYRSLPSEPAVETVAQASGFNGTIPRWQTSTTCGWSRDAWRLTLGWQHIPGVADPEGDGTPVRPRRIAAYDAVDAAIAYDFRSARRWLRGLTLRLGANNLFNAMPPFGGGTFAGANADIGTYSPIGRLLFCEGKYKF